MQEVLGHPEGAGGEGDPVLSKIEDERLERPGPVVRSQRDLLEELRALLEAVLISLYRGRTICIRG